MRQRLFFLLLVVQTATAQLPQVATGTLQRLENFPSKYVPARHVDIWLPEGYDSTKKYAVLYMHDGQMLFDSNTTWNRQEWGVDETAGDLLDKKHIRDCIVVGIWNAGQNRYPEYFPQQPYEHLSPQGKEMVLQVARQRHNQGNPAVPYSDNYLKFLVTELKPYIDTHFSTHRDRQNTFIAGSSMGGLISLYAICEYPQTFGGAACLSTHWPGIFRLDNNPVPDAFIRYLDRQLPDPKTHKIYFDFGTETLDSLYKPVQVRVDSLMTKKGFNPLNWQTHEFTGADHTERAWRERFAVPMAFLLPLFYQPRYEGNPIIWNGERFFGNIKSVESQWFPITDSIKQKQYGGKEIIRFNENWEVTEHYRLSYLGDTVITIRPIYNANSQPVVQSVFQKSDGLNMVSINEYRHGALVKSTEYTSNGEVLSIRDYQYLGDTSLVLNRPFSLMTQTSDDAQVEKTLILRKSEDTVRILKTRGKTVLYDWKLLEIKHDVYGNWIELKAHVRVHGLDGYDEADVNNRRKIEYYRH